MKFQNTLGLLSLPFSLIRLAKPERQKPYPAKIALPVFLQGIVPPYASLFPFLHLHPPPSTNFLLFYNTNPHISKERSLHTIQSYRTYHKNLRDPPPTGKKCLSPTPPLKNPPKTPPSPPATPPIPTISPRILPLTRPHLLRLRLRNLLPSLRELATRVLRGEVLRRSRRRVRLRRRRIGCMRRGWRRSMRRGRVVLEERDGDVGGVGEEIRGNEEGRERDRKKGGRPEDKQDDKESVENGD